MLSCDDLVTCSVGRQFALRPSSALVVIDRPKTRDRQFRMDLGWRARVALL